MHIFREATQHHQQYRRRCNAFFMELVSRLCFADGTPPEGGVINMLMNLIIGEARSKQKKRTLTRKMSVFDDCIDTTPVVRSFLLQLLLRSRSNYYPGARFTKVCTNNFCSTNLLSLC